MNPASRMERPASSGRRIGPIGTAARVAGGLAAVTVPAAVSGLTWWDVGAGLAILPLTAALTAAAVSAALASRPRARHAQLGAAEPWIRSALVLMVVIGIAVAATFLTPLDGPASAWIFIGVSLLVGALRGDAGCEAVAIPNAIAGRTDPTGCVIYSPLDRMEATRDSRRRPRPLPKKEVPA